MFCQRCQKSLRSRDGLNCSVCQSKFHLKCINDEASKETCKNFMSECGDRSVSRTCSLCHFKTTSNTKMAEINNSKENLVTAIQIITEKIERINNIQLPKLKDEISQVKMVTYRIAQQNSDILKRMSELNNWKSSEKRLASYRKRNLNFTALTCSDKNDYVPMSAAELKSARYHTRRKSFILNRMLHLLNRKRRFQKKTAINL